MNIQAPSPPTPAPAPAGTALPTVNQVFEPASVRHGSPAVQKAYRADLAFEQVLVEQLAKSLTVSAGVGGEESSGEDEGSGSSSGAEASSLSSSLPQALSAGIMNAGGLGMAAQLANQLQTISPQSAAAGGAAVSPSSGGTETAPKEAPTASALSGGTAA